MIQDFNDYPEEWQAFKVLKAEPLHIQLSPQSCEGDPPEVIKDLVR